MPHSSQETASAAHPAAAPETGNGNADTTISSSSNQMIIHRRRQNQLQERLLSGEHLDGTETNADEETNGAPTTIRPTLSGESSSTLRRHHHHHHSQHHIVTLNQLTLPEKLLLLTGSSLWTLHGIPRLHLPSVTVSDGGHGVRKPKMETSLQHSFPATCFPPMCALACSWDRDLLDRVGRTIALECRHYNVSVLLGPGLNLKRHPCGGRNFEYFSEDPLVSGTLAAAFIRGVQASQHVAACPKHFCVNNQETHRFVVNALVDPRTCRELYYRSFEIAVKESKPATIMCAYNKVNGTYASEHPFLLTKLLREEWGFDGICMTDWGATHDRAAGIAAGMDLEMPGSHGAHERSIRQALQERTLSEEDIEKCSHRVLNLINKYKATSTGRGPKVEIDWEQHAQIAREAARDSIVLLKNDDNILPLPRNASVGLIGDFAKDHPRIQGMGSAQVTAHRIETVYDEMQQYTDKITFAPGYVGDDDHPTEFNTDLLQEAVEVARHADVVVLFIGLPEIMESEGMDREHMRLPAQHTALLNEVLAVNDNTIVVLTNGGTVQLPEACCSAKAILEGYLLGQSGGGAICDILFGQQSPCGKLPETMPLMQDDVLCDKYFPGVRDMVCHLEGLDVGYRYFNSGNKAVQFPFGHGLSYTSFEFSNLRIEIQLDDVDEKTVLVAFDLSNTGAMAGKEVVQLYVRDVEASVYRPSHELRAYTKVFLEQGETKPVKLRLDEKAFAVWDIGHEGWVVEAGDYEIQIGSSSRVIALRQTISLQTGREISDTARKSYPPVLNGDLNDVDNEMFAARFGLQADEVLAEIRGGPISTLFDRNSLLKETAKISLIGRMFLHIVFSEASKEIEAGPSELRQKRMIRANVENLPLRVLVLFSKGGLSFALLDGIIAVFNGYYCVALMCLVYASIYAVKDTLLELSGRRRT